MDLNYKDVGARLKIARGKLTQQAFSELYGISVSYVKKTERGGKPSLEYLVEIAIKQGVSLDWLLLGVQTRNEKIEVIMDPDLRNMIDVLKSIYDNGDPELRAWAKVQFAHTFNYYIDSEKKRRRITEEGSTYRA